MVDENLCGANIDAGRFSCPEMCLSLRRPDIAMCAPDLRLLSVGAQQASERVARMRGASVRRTVCYLVMACLWGCTRTADNRRDQSRDSSPSEFQILVEPGDEGSARTYYQRIGSRLQLPLLDSSGRPEATLDGLMAYLGFTGLSAADLEGIASRALMPRTAAEFAVLAKRVSNPDLFLKHLKLEHFQNDNILVSRFFAPKIVNYTQAPPYAPGWRKLVVLQPVTGSAADKAGIQSASILFNFVEADLTKDPFQGSSKNNQVVLVPRSAGNEDTAYFLVYLARPEYRLGFALQNVAFDLPEPKDYFVPVACAQCHGHDARSGESSPKPTGQIYKRARLNFLDTDQWHDAMAFDFKHLLDTPHAVVFDGGKDVKSETYRESMAVLRTINGRIRAQNATVDASDVKLKAVEKWLELHATNDGPATQATRAVDSGQGNVWNPSNAEEQELLGLLNHYCYRCHSSIRYNVFDKDGVAAASLSFPGRLNAQPGSVRHMPQGRVLDGPTKDRIIELSERLFP
jgi:hypothetical protein